MFHLYIRRTTHLVSNYRPISLLSTVGKGMEKVIHKHMFKFQLVYNQDLCLVIQQLTNLLIFIIHFVKL